MSLINKVLKEIKELHEGLAPWKNFKCLQDIRFGGHNYKKGQVFLFTCFGDRDTELIYTPKGYKNRECKFDMFTLDVMYSLERIKFL